MHALVINFRLTCSRLYAVMITRGCERFCSNLHTIGITLLSISTCDERSIQMNGSTNRICQLKTIENSVCFDAFAKSNTSLAVSRNVVNVTKRIMNLYFSKNISSLGKHHHFSWHWYTSLNIHISYIAHAVGVYVFYWSHGPYFTISNKYFFGIFH